MAEGEREIAVDIPAPAGEVYDFAAEPTNLPRWAMGLAQAEITPDGDEWVADSPMGTVRVRFTERTPFPATGSGILDHTVTLPSGEQVLNPLRVEATDDGCRVVFTVRRRAGMSAEEFAQDALAVELDLHRLAEQVTRHR